MKLKIFPFSICRITAFQPSELDVFRSDKLNALLAECKSLYGQLECKKEGIIDGLYYCIRRAELSQQERNRLIKLKRDIYNDRFIRDKIKVEEHLILDHTLLAEVNDFIAMVHQKSVIENSIHATYNFCMLNTRLALIKYANEYPLKNGILFSSQDLFRSIARLKHITEEELITTKKYDSIFSSLLNYLTRSATKTSPFSSFNTLILAELTRPDSADKVQNTGGKSTITINNLLYLRLKEWILSSQDHLDRLTVCLNSTLVESNGGLRYFRHSENNEDFCFLPINNPLIFNILQFVETERPSFGQLVFFLKDHMSVDDSPIDFARRLIRSGILLVHFPISIGNRDWLMDFCDYLKHHDGGKNPQLIYALESVHHVREELESITDIDKKNERLEKLFEELIKVEFDFKGLNKSNLFYEDVVDTANYPFEVGNLKKSFEEIKVLSNILFQMDFKSISRKLIYSTLKEYAGYTKISLLEYYEKVYLNGNLYNQAIANYNQKYLDLFADFFTLILQGNRLYLCDFLKDLNEQVPLTSVSFDLFMQLSKDSKLVVNNILHAAGMNITRFYHLFPDLEKLLARTCLCTDENAVIAQLRDSSMHNTQIQSSSTDVIIDVSQSIFSDSLIPLTKLYLRCLENGTVRIEDDHQRVIIPMDFSMESLGRRSSLFKFINQFSADNSEGITMFRELYIHIARAKNELDERVIHLPRLYLSASVVIERESWIFPQKFLSKTFKKVDGEETAYIWFDHWRTKNKVPFDGFITYKPAQTTKHTKPQYINFKSPAYFKQFYQEILTESCNGLIFKEVLPEFSETKSKGYFPGHCEEFIINFTS